MSLMINYFQIFRNEVLIFIIDIVFVVSCYFQSYYLDFLISFSNLKQKKYNNKSCSFIKSKIEKGILFLYFITFS